MKKEVTNRIAAIREQQGYTLQQVADAIGVGNNTISRYETGIREPKLATWQKLANFFEVSVPYLQGIKSYLIKPETGDVVRIPIYNLFMSNNDVRHYCTVDISDEERYELTEEHEIPEETIDMILGAAKIYSNVPFRPETYIDIKVREW